MPEPTYGVGWLVELRGRERMSGVIRTFVPDEIDPDNPRRVSREEAIRLARGHNFYRSEVAYRVHHMVFPQEMPPGGHRSPRKATRRPRGSKTLGPVA